MGVKIDGLDMKHVTDLQLIELAGGRLSAEERAEVDSHVTVCQRCRAELEQFERTWQQMGEWQVEADERDLAGIVEASARERAKRMPQRLIWNLGLARAAAAIVLAVIIGHGVGRMSLSSGPEGEPSQEEEAMVNEALYLEVFAELTPANLTEHLLDPQIAEGQEN